jgi:hypothetical protein
LPRAAALLPLVAAVRHQVHLPAIICWSRRAGVGRRSHNPYGLIAASRMVTAEFAIMRLPNNDRGS